jgi:osmotically-inducible protein OsmY
VCGLLIALSSLLYAQNKSSQYDEQIQKDVNKLLESKKEYKAVHATVADQEITLEGTVPLYIHKANLQKKSGKIKNVEAVRNHVQVEGNVPDNQLRETLADKLRYDRVGYGNVFNAITLEVQDGVATIGGTVRDYPSRDSAVALAATTPGVKDVVDNIEVAPNSGFDDDLRLRLYRAIYQYPALQRYATDPQKPIRIVVNGGHVTLMGVVDSPLDKQVAGTRANQVSGVFSVDNQLIVANEKSK